MLSIILKLVISHIFADFVLQPSSWIEKRNNNPIKSKYFYFHIGVHLLSTTLILINQIGQYWAGILLIICSHYLIDLGKISLEKNSKIKKLSLFVLDQLLHLIVIAIVVNIYFPYKINFGQIFSDKYMLILVSILIASTIAPIVMRLFFDRWNKSLQSTPQNHEESLNTESLHDAGKYIGILERLLIIVFINMGFPEGIGYLLAAKSIFRFGDLTNSKEKKLTEYILIGTFMSFAIAIIVGFALKRVLEKVK